MKKILLKNINPDVAQIVSFLWLISVLVVGMLAFEAYKVQIVAFSETHGSGVILLAFLVYAAIGSYPWMRVYPSHPKKEKPNG